MYMKLFLLITILILLSCKNNSEKNEEFLSDSEVPAYEIIDKKKNEKTRKTKNVVDVLYKDTIFNREDLKRVLLDVYEKNKNENEFQYHDKPTVLGVYIYTSKESATDDRSSWIGMLTKVPKDILPALTYNDFRMEGQKDLHSNETSEDEKDYQDLLKYFQQRDIDFCEFYKNIGKIEKESIDKADEKYPEFGIKHLDYSEELIQKERTKLSRQHHIHDSIFTYAVVFGSKYCP